MRASARVVASLLVLSCVVALALGCGGAQAPAPAPEVGASIVADESGVLYLRSPDWDAPYATLVPARWPEELGTPPVLGFGDVIDRGDGLRLRVWASTHAAAPARIRALPTHAPEPLTHSKLLTTVTSIDGTSITMSAGQSLGVQAGDLYFVVNRAEPGARIGARTGALVRISAVDETSARGRVEHARHEIAAGDALILAQPGVGSARSTAVIAIAPFAPGEPAGDLPELGAAIPDLLARYGISNISLVGAHGYVDPIPFDAPDTAARVAPEGYGVLLFGRAEDGDVIVNTTTFGAAPRFAQTVGILPGGLRLPMPDGGRGALSEALAPALVATALALRGEDAVAAYLLEDVLETATLDAAVRYHLREHLALRYQELRFIEDALDVISTDIESARASGATRPLLNALSIRAAIDEEAGHVHQWILDAEEFVAIATDELPEEAVLWQQVDQANALNSAGESERSRALAHGVARRARERADVGLEIAATMAMIWTVWDTPSDALALLGGVFALMEEASATDRVFVEAVRAELCARVDDLPCALESAARAVDGAATMPNGSARASILSRTAEVLYDIEQWSDAIATSREASRLQVESSAYADAARGFERTSAASIAALRAGGLDPEAAAAVAAEARDSLLIAGTVWVWFGRAADAANALMWASAVQRGLGALEPAATLLATAEAYAFSTADFWLLNQVCAAVAEVAEADGDADRSARYARLAEEFGRIDASFAGPGADGPHEGSGEDGVAAGQGAPR